MPNPPIKITLYDPVTNEVKAEYVRNFVPWKLLKAAIRLSKSLHETDLSEEDIDNIASLVVDTFGGQFTMDELNNSADVSEMMAVITAITSRAQGLTTNPPPPGR